MKSQIFSSRLKSFTRQSKSKRKKPFFRLFLMLSGFAVLLSLVLLFSWASKPANTANQPLPLQNSAINPDDNRLYTINESENRVQPFDEVVAQVLPEEGFQSKISLSDSIVKLVEKGLLTLQSLKLFIEAATGCRLN